ncbi:Retrovirus-related Pol polyprotein from transposon 17.6 [Porphyridium purpureum]|uniref:Retrovirus-related Pol polyprotein from transposon 17.6 n=1 Tax=Porphyridium purpureum TaxID=35688 RepID=A0A5J4YQH5_PORPP|nr:Retrovirus-related Pol polyprotein from transposon 17.6 [Porphyridium purpureum]|eukprot:POR7970..scf236_6
MSPAVLRLRADCSNYAACTVQMKMILCQKLAWTAIAADGSVDAEKDKRALGLLGAHVDPLIMYIVADARTAREAWERLELTAKASAPTYVRELKRELSNFRASPGEPASRLIGRLTALCRELTLAGAPASDEDAVNALLDELPRKYGAVEQTWIAGGGRASLSAILPLVLVAERAAARENAAVPDHARAHALQAVGNPRVPKTLRCRNFNRVGHVRRECPLGSHKGEPKQMQSRPSTYSLVAYSAAESACAIGRAEKEAPGKPTYAEVVQRVGPEEECGELADKSLLRNPQKARQDIITADGKRLMGTLVGSVKLGGGVFLNDVLFVLGLTKNLMSVAALAKRGASVRFDGTNFAVQATETTGQVTGIVLSGQLQDNLYIVFVPKTLEPLSGTAQYAASAKTASARMRMHERVTGHKRCYTVTKLACLAVVWCLKKVRHYVFGTTVRIRADHEPLHWLLSMKEPRGRLARWALTIQDFSFTIENIKGRLNRVPDALSRLELNAVRTRARRDPVAEDPVVSTDEDDPRAFGQAVDY